MEGTFWIEFFFASMLMGLAIGLDAAIVTGIRSAHIRSIKSRCIWVGGIAFTHTVFPLLGYLLSYYGVKQFPLLTPLIGLLAFALIMWFLMEELKSGHEQSDTDSNHDTMVNFALMLAVSWDALWSGPAKSAQVIQWPEVAIWVSFIVVGCVVTLLMVIALVASEQIHRFREWNMASVFGQLLSWLQYSIIGYFGILALTKYTLNFDVSSLYVLLLSFFLMAIALHVRYKHSQ